MSLGDDVSSLSSLMYDPPSLPHNDTLTLQEVTQLALNWARISSYSLSSFLYLRSTLSGRPSSIFRLACFSLTPPRCS